MTTTDNTTPKSTEAEWTPPGAGEWELDLSHSPPAPTHFMRRIGAESATTAYERVFERYGAPLKTLQVAFVNGKMYRRLVPLVGADSNRKPPPAAVLKIAARLHPAFRKRNKTANESFANRGFLAPIGEWERRERQQWIDANLALQNVDLSSLSDPQLADHVRQVGAHCLDGWTRHHELHGTDLGPIGDMLAHTNRWGLDPVDVMATLQGSSPATTEAAGKLAAVAEAAERAGVDVTAATSLDDIRSAGTETATLLDAYLELFGDRIVTSYDIEGLTANELPEATLAALQAAAATADVDQGAAADAVRDRLRTEVDPEFRSQFDQLAEDARRAYGLRDDNGPLTAEWPIGLARKTYLAAGDRLAAAGRFAQAADAFELDIDELASVLDGSPSPDQDEIDRRAAHRRWEAGLDAPLTLGPASPPPDPSILPGGLRRIVEGVVTAVSLLEPDHGEATPLQGLGIGTRSYSGRARVAERPEDVLMSMEAGDILVAAWTAPTYNTVLAAAGGIVVQEGGLLCHAAVMARELDIPAVIGVQGAMDDIGDGDIIEVDPTSGVVTIVERAS